MTNHVAGNTRLARLVMPAAFAALTLVVTGCLKVEPTLNLKADGSGSLELNYSVAEDAVQRARAMQRLRDQLNAISGSPAQTNTTLADISMTPEETQIRKELKPYEASGLKVEQLRVRSVEGWRQVQMTLAFRSLADLARTDLFADYGFTMVENAKGNYVMFRDKADDADSLPAGTDATSSKMLAPLLQGLRIDIKVITPGRILQSNAHRSSLQTANWLFDYDQDANALINLQKQQFKIQFEGKDVKLPTIMSPRHAIDQ